MEVVILIGIPASGKSTFFRERFADTHVRINRDMLRTGHREEQLFEWCLGHRQPCVVDNTNTTREVRGKWLQRCREAGVAVSGYYFQSRIADCLQRNRERQGRARIPDAGVRDHHARLECPARDEGFDRLFHVALAPEGFHITEWRHEV